MAGILDFYSNPQLMGLLGISSGLLEAGGPQRFPVSFGQAAGRGLLQGAQMGQSTANQELRNAYLKSQTGYTDAQTEAAKAVNARQAQLAPFLAQLAGRFGQQPAGAATALTGNPMTPGHPGSSVMAGGPVGVPAQPQAKSGGFPLSLEDVSILKLLGGPDLTSAFTAGQPNMSVEGGFLLDKKRGIQGTVPQISQQGGFSQFQPQPGGGYSVSAVPGGQQLQKEQVGIAEEGKAKFDLSRVPDGKGGFITMPRSQAAKSLGVGGPRGLGYEQPTSVTAGNTAFSEGKAKEAVGEAAKFREAYFQGQSTRGNLDLLQTIFGDPNVASGAAAEQISGLKGVADSFGISIAGKGYEDVARAVGGEMALRMKNQGGTNLMPGAMSNFEQDLLRQMSPGLAQSRDGRLMLTQVFRAKVDRDIALAELAAQYEDRNGRLDAGFYRQAREFVKANPMFSEERVKAMTELAKRLSSGR